MAQAIMDPEQVRRFVEGEYQEVFSGDQGTGHPPKHTPKGQRPEAYRLHHIIAGGEPEAERDAPVLQQPNLFRYTVHKITALDFHLTTFTISRRTG